MTRTAQAVERAGKLNRAQSHLEEAKRHVEQAYRELDGVADHAETMAIASQVMMRNDEALRRLAKA